MPLKDTTLFGMLTDKMRWLTQRQRVLAQNIANADTPNYTARDLRPLEFRGALRVAQSNVSLARTNVAHLSARTDADAFRTERNRAPYETSPDRNKVVLEEQLMKLSETRADHQLATQLFQKYTSLYRTALGAGQGGGQR